MNRKEFTKGIKDGMPICLGYFSVSVAFGMNAVLSGFPGWAAVLTSITNLTSAGQFAGVNIMLAGGNILELIVTILIINARYFLMSLFVSQKASAEMTLPQRYIVAFGITDEIFAVSMHRDKSLTISYMLGLMLMPVVGWTLGTLTGSVATTVMPQALALAMGVALYGMFIAIIIPPAKNDRRIMVSVVLAIVLSIGFRYLPLLEKISSGWSIIIIAVLVSGFCAYKFPLKEEEQ